MLSRMEYKLLGLSLENVADRLTIVYPLSLEDVQFSSVSAHKFMEDKFTKKPLHVDLELKDEAMVDRNTTLETSSTILAIRSSPVDK